MRLADIDVDAAFDICETLAGGPEGSGIGGGNWETSWAAASLRPG
jgi:hypothetical protein